MQLNWWTFLRAYTNEIFATNIAILSESSNLIFPFLSPVYRKRFLTQTFVNFKMHSFVYLKYDFLSTYFCFSDFFLLPAVIIWKPIIENVIKFVFFFLYFYIKFRFSFVRRHENSLQLMTFWQKDMPCWDIYFYVWYTNSKSFRHPPTAWLLN